jgi:hypothetical protein
MTWILFDLEPPKIGLSDHSLFDYFKTIGKPGERFANK